eukprot:6920357-Pyramimonas_sp.AAC.1
MRALARCSASDGPQGAFVRTSSLHLFFSLLASFLPSAAPPSSPSSSFHFASSSFPPYSSSSSSSFNRRRRSPPPPPPPPRHECQLRWGAGEGAGTMMELFSCLGDGPWGPWGPRLASAFNFCMFISAALITMAMLGWFA